MSYRQARVTTFITCYIVSFVFTYINIDSGDSPEVIALKFMLAAFAGFALTVIAWCIGRTAYVENMLDETSLSEKDIKIVWDASGDIAVNKDLKYVDLYAMAYDVHNRAMSQSTAISAEVFHVCVAAVLVRYSSLWKKDILCKDPEILEAIDQYYDRMKMVRILLKTYLNKE